MTDSDKALVALENCLCNLKFAQDTIIDLQDQIRAKDKWINSLLKALELVMTDNNIKTTAEIDKALNFPDYERV